MEQTAAGGHPVSTDETTNERNHHMEPIHICALLNTHVDEELRRKDIEHYYALRAQLRQERRRRLRRAQLLFTRRRAPMPTPQSVAPAG
jgi:hypothetical protein